MKHSLKILIRISVEIMGFPERKRFSWRLKITREKVLLNTVFDHVYEHLCLASLLAVCFGFSSSDTVGGGGIHLPSGAVLARQPAPLPAARSWDHQAGEHGSTTQCHPKGSHQNSHKWDFQCFCGSSEMPVHPGGKHQDLDQKNSMIHFLCGISRPDAHCSHVCLQCKAMLNWN